MFQKQFENTRKKGGHGPLGPSPKSAYVYVNLDWAFVDPWILLHDAEIIQSEAYNCAPYSKMAVILVFFSLLAN